MVKPYLSVVIPSYNEMVNLQKGVLDKVEHFLSKRKMNYEVVVVDDGSDDGSVEFVEQFTKENSRFRLIKNHHSGKAGAVTKGMLDATGEIILFTDMDQATPIEELDKLLPSFQKGYDIVIGSRNKTRKGSPWSRLIISRGLMILRDIIVGIKGLKDTQCGFKAFTYESSQRIFKKMDELNNGFKTLEGSAVKAGFDVELLFLAQMMGYKIKEEPVNWLYVETRRVSPIRDSIDGFLYLIKIRLNSMRGIYN